MSFVIAMALLFAGGEVNYIPAKDVNAAMVKAPPAPIIKVDNYSVMAIRRTEAGQSEVHEKDTDVFYVIDGAATFTTGGSMIEGKSTGPGEIRGAGIREGKGRRIAKGDVLTIPAGTPHWFSAVESSVTYFVVKVR